MSARTLLISAISSGQGKTTVTAALARRFTREGLRVHVFKTGADFLDALVLERACGRPVHVLDLWMVGEAECRRRLDEAVLAADLVLIEGVMGLYDGTPSSADLAREFDLPVLAVIDVSAMAQTVGAVAHGLRDFGRLRVAGVVANRVASEGHKALVAGALRDIPLVAHLPRQSAPLAERHLGLVPPGDGAGIDAQLDALDRTLELDSEAWERIPANYAREPDAMRPGTAPGTRLGTRPGTRPLARLLEGKRIAIAHDAAFAFLYPANVECLRALGAQLSFFSPLAGDAVPAGAQALLLPGGYPELYAEPLSRALRFHESLRAAHTAGVPMLAECGGMMVLAESIGDLEGRQWPMAAILPGRTQMQRRLAGLGLQHWPTRHGDLRGHTFHYSTFETPLVAAARTRTHPRDTDGESIYRSGALTASYFHAYFASCPEAAAALLEGSEP